MSFAGFLILRKSIFIIYRKSTAFGDFDLIISIDLLKLIRSHCLNGSIIFITMKKLLICLFMITVGFTVFSQEVYQDVIYLKNGEIISGIIVEQIPGISMKIETSENKVVTIKMEEIENITKEKTTLNLAQQNNIKSRFEGNAALGYDLGSSDYGLDRLMINFSLGYSFYPVFFIGAGLGVRQYPDLKATIIPVYFDFRGILMDRKVSPFVSAQFGTSFDVTNEFKNVGLMINPNVGVNFRLTDDSQVYMSFGYEFQYMNFYNMHGGYHNVSKQNNGAISFRVGFTF